MTIDIWPHGILITALFTKSFSTDNIVSYFKIIISIGHGRAPMQKEWVHQCLKSQVSEKLDGRWLVKQKTGLWWSVGKG